MMAFFLLMWLLNATTEEQRKGLADYFDPSVPVSPVSGGGTDVLDGDSVYAADDLAYDNHGGLAEDMASDAELAAELTAALQAQIADGQVKVTLSDEGVVVDLIDADGAPLFALGGASASPLLHALVAAALPVLVESDRPLKLVGHTDDLRFRTDNYTNWELSADRANAARRAVLAAGLPASRISEVAGRADRQPTEAGPGAAENRRVSIILLNSAAR
jgi:chemotaxis protein MotB